MIILRQFGCYVGIAIVLLGFTAIARTQEAEKSHLILTSWYNEGKVTATGEKFDPMGLTAASRSLPPQSRWLLTNPTNHRKVIVRINDKGPYVAPRGLDVTQGVARLLGFERSGLAWLLIEPAPPTTHVRGPRHPHHRVSQVKSLHPN